MQRTEIKQLFADAASFAQAPVTVCGWVRTIRTSKALGFIELNDGSYFQNLQVVFEDGKIPNFFVNLWTKSRGTAKTFQSA